MWEQVLAASIARWQYNHAQPLTLHYLETGVTHDVTIISLWRLLVHTIFHIVDPYITIILHL